MKCVDAQRLIRPYLNRELSVKEPEQFLAHVESCDDCMEELEISLALEDAMADETGLEGAQMYDIKSELDEDLREAHQFVHLRRGIRLFRMVTALAAELVLVILMVTGIEMKLQDGREGTTLYRIWNRGGQTTAPKKPEASGQVFPETEMSSEQVIEAASEMPADAVLENGPEKTPENKEKK